MEQIRTFEGGLNTDDSMETMPASDYPFLLNGIRGKSSNGNKGTIENQIGTAAAVAGAPSELDANSTCIGWIRDQKDNSRYLFFHNTDSTKNCIIKFIRNSGIPTLTKVINWTGLAFSTQFFITGGAVVDGVIYFTDNLNGCRAVSLSASAIANPTTEEEISLLKRGGIYPPTFVKSIAAVDQNLTAKFGFQFAYQYVYVDNQYSVLSPYSTLCPQNTNAQTFNKITVTVSDAIPVQVRKVKFAARIGNNGSFFYIGDLNYSPWVSSAPYLIGDIVFSVGKWWMSRTVHTDAIVPVEGLIWTSAISIDFFNNTNGNLVPTSYLSQVHAVPIKAKGLEMIKNRLWVANYVEGYDTPKDAGLVVTSNPSILVVGVATTVSKTIWNVNKVTFTWNASGSFWAGGSNANETGSSVPFNGGSTTTIMIVDPISTPSANGTSITGQRVQWNAGSSFYENTTPAFTGVSGSFAPPNQVGAFDGEIKYFYQIVSFQPSQNYTTGIDNGSTYEGTKTFPSGSSYKVGYIFKDSSGRPTGVVTSVGTVINTQKTYANIITAGWTLPTSPAAGTIPIQARSYSIVMSKNLTKSYFLEYRSTDARYYKGTTTTTAYSADNDGIQLDITPIGKAGIGYEFIEGDRIILYPTQTTDGFNIPADTTTVRDLAITSFDGTLIKCPNVNIGAFNSGAAKTTFEIYRPISKPEEILYYEIGQSFPISSVTNFATPTDGKFSTTSGTITGDSVNSVRDNFRLNAAVYTTDSSPYAKGLYKAMSISATGAWDTDAGKPYIQTTIGQITKTNYFRFSATIINDTSVNGLSEMYALDEGNVPKENGEINKLKSASRQSNEGNVLLAICRNETASIYVDEQRMNLDQSTSFMIQSASVIGAVNTLKSNSLGTQNPESVYDYNGSVYWWDGIRRQIVRYSSNGLYPISDVKMIDHFEDVGESNTVTVWSGSITYSIGSLVSSGGNIWRSLTAHTNISPVEGVNWTKSSANVITGYDPYYRVFYFTFGNEPIGLSYTRKTVSWSEEEGRWISFHSFAPAMYIDLDHIVFSIVNGSVFPHTNKGAFNTFYGTVRDTVLEVFFNDSPSQPKYWSAVSMLLSKNFWTWVGGEQVIATNGNGTARTLKFDLENDYGQAGDVMDDRFDYDENIAYGNISKDKNTAISNPAVNGDDIFSHVAKGRVTILGQASDVYKRLNFLKIGFELSKGHQL